MEMEKAKFSTGPNTVICHGIQMVSTHIPMLAVGCWPLRFVWSARPPIAGLRCEAFDNCTGNINHGFLCRQQMDL